jgi:hypothetical protein
MAGDMSSPIFDSTFGTGRFRYEEATKSPEPQDVRQALELQLFDLVELARDTRSDKGGEAKWVHPCGALVKEFAKRIAALAQSDEEPFPQPQRNDGGEPCGECHLQTGETCDVCGALAQSAEPKGIDLDDADRAYDKWAEHRNGQSRLDAFRAGVEFGLRHTALAQSGAGPVAWQHMFDLLKAARQMACRAVTASGGLDATPRTMLDIAALIGEAEEGLLTKPPLYTAPPLPDASAGLIEAATLERYARSIAMWCYRENVTDFERLSYIVNHPVTRRYAKRARAADRSA